MSLEYTITYRAENEYEALVREAFWQFLILPENNGTQQLLHHTFTNSLNIDAHQSINGLGFQTLQVHSKTPLKKISFKLECSILKEEINPFDFSPNLNVSEDYKIIESRYLQAEHEAYLRDTNFTALPKKHHAIFVFDRSKSIFENLQNLNHWVYNHLHFKAGMTTVNTLLDEIIEKRHGVCQDFTHLFCALARENQIPTRYVSGYLHQGNGYFGDLQMHAWAEAYTPQGGWIGFDPTNDILVAHNHIKVAHGKDYSDCAPLKGVVHASGKNQTTHTVQVQASQQQ